ncbi:ribosomal L11 methyltransferase [Desulfatibacillum aliphaticivorans]|uniref:Ribosomal L11 methyltransferase n=1 Tax=Desulfatibacillum aliphaticivorans TaxID=218208 RepID=B8FME6_DESAL|nr:50S ribosomal protein L11 methyltransferase [Desulfatibacillum aliphaticivorans]ACL05984.1 ribosomal L11 methyltransferase [Desulfatibacillum aliphaticivorans]
MKAIQTTSQGMSEWIMERVARSMRIPQPELEKDATVAGASWTRREIRKTVRALMEQGRLMYTYELGTSFLEENFSGASRLGFKIIAVPPGQIYRGSDEDVPLVMKQGASFGSGRHPTTRMAVKAIEQVLSPDNPLRPQGSVLDAGTGTGVLALSALKLGMENALCTDIDPCALFETRENALLNGLENRVRVEDIPIPEIPGRYSLILANLRFPTLVEAMPVFTQTLIEPGWLIVSGIQVAEAGDMELEAKKHGFVSRNLMTEQKWACMIFLQENHKELTNGEV